MELYIFFAFLLLYIITSMLLPRNLLRKIWTLAFISSFAITSIAIGFVRLSRQDVMMNANQLNWYYVLFLFGIVSVALGVFNLWMYRKPLMKIIFSSSEETEDETDK